MVILICILTGVAVVILGGRPRVPMGKLTGTVILYPIGPVCSQVSQCSRPDSGQTVEVDRIDGTILKKTRTNDQGIYTFNLPAGDYSLAVPPARYGRGANKIDGPIKLQSGMTVTVNATIDTGIR